MPAPSRLPPLLVALVLALAGCADPGPVGADPEPRPVSTSSPSTTTPTSTSTLPATATPETSTTTSSPTTTPSTTTTTEAAGLPEGIRTTVTRVVDGDTIDVAWSGERVRLIGIDTPEVHSGVECYGREASRHAAGLMGPGTEVVIELDVAERDRYGRLLGYLWRVSDGLFLNEAMVADGYAQVFTVPPNVRYVDQLLEAQREAREAGRGLWSACPADATTTTNRVLSFARETVQDPSGDRRRQRIRWWSALALLRALASSPAAAAATLRTRSVTTDATDVEEADDLGRRFVFDAPDEDADATDTVPGSDPDEESETTRRRLRQLANDADALRGDADAKLVGAVGLIDQLVTDGHHPIVFCRFIDTAEYVAAELRDRLKGNVEVAAVTGRIPSAERERRVEELGQAERRVLVATDCLSEGINLQDHFTAVLHYDLPWNPTRLEQREGRVDRFGQRAPTVRIVTYYGNDNLIDRAVLDVLVTKHRTIRRDLGISIPVPGTTAEVMEAVSQAVLEQEESGIAQTPPGLDEYVRPAAESLIQAWEDAAAREKASRSLFAQHSLRPEEVAGFADAAQRALGTSADIATFVTQAVTDLGGVVTPATPTVLDLSEVRSTAKAYLGVWDDKPLRVRFDPPVREGETLLTRSHPLVAGLANWVLSTALDPAADRPIAARAGAIRTDAVDRRTTLILTRFRFHLTTIRDDRERQLLAEQAAVHAFTGAPDHPEWLDTHTAVSLLSAEPTANVTPRQATDFVGEVVDTHPAWMPWLEAALDEEAAELLHQHRAAREAAAGTGRFRVDPLTPVDVLGLYVLLPDLR